MGISTVMFDLDGTLLPMDNDEFTRGYFKLLAAKLAPYGYEAGPLIDGIWSGVAAMVSNDGSRTNEEAFWARFAEVLGDRVFEHRPVLEEFYAVDFKAASRFCGFNPAAAFLSVTCASALACLTPMASTSQAIAVGAGRYTIGQYCKSNFMFFIVGTVTMAITIPLLLA